MADFCGFSARKSGTAKKPVFHFLQPKNGGFLRFVPVFHFCKGVGEKTRVCRGPRSTAPKGRKWRISAVFRGVEHMEHRPWPQEPQAADEKRACPDASPISSREKEKPEASPVRSRSTCTALHHAEGGANPRGETRHMTENFVLEDATDVE